LGLAPPPGCPEQGWICVAFPCRSFKRLQNLPYRTVKNVRTWLGHSEEETKDYLKFWQATLKAKVVTSEEPYIALTLFPVKDLPKRLFKKVLNKKIPPHLKPYASNLFVNSDYFTFRSKSKLSEFNKKSIGIRYKAHQLSICNSPKRRKRIDSWVTSHLFNIWNQSVETILALSEEFHFKEAEDPSGTKPIAFFKLGNN
jgi:hypothetical protein